MRRNKEDVRRNEEDLGEMWRNHYFLGFLKKIESIGYCSKDRSVFFVQ